MSSSISEHKKSKVGRPVVDSEMVRARLERGMLTALDRFSAAESITRSEAIRTILNDWLRTHGFAGLGKQIRVQGPATEAVKLMDVAIDEHKKTTKAKSRKRQPASTPKTRPAKGQV